MYDYFSVLSRTLANILSHNQNSTYLLLQNMPLNYPRILFGLDLEIVHTASVSADDQREIYMTHTL